MQHHTSAKLYCLRELDRMTVEDWQRIPLKNVPISKLMPTQSTVLIDRLLDLSEGKPRQGGDLYGHVIEFQGQLYIHDGHHDLIRFWLRDQSRALVRIKQIDSPCVDPCCQKGKH